MAAYCTVSYFTRLYDSRTLRENLSDSGKPVAADDLETNENLLQILNEASEHIAAACEVGKRYSAGQLAALAALEDGGYLLKRLTADLAFGLVMARRGRSTADVERLAPMFGRALATLELLRTGAHLFPGVPDGTHAEAGLPSVQNLRDRNDPNRINTLTTQARRLFPSSCDRIPNPGSDCC